MDSTERRRPEALRIETVYKKERNSIMQKRVFLKTIVATAAAAAAKATDEKEKATLPAGSFKVPDTANVA